MYSNLVIKKLHAQGLFSLFEPRTIPIKQMLDEKATLWNKIHFCSIFGWTFLNSLQLRGNHTGSYVSETTATTPRENFNSSFQSFISINYFVEFDLNTTFWKNEIGKAVNIENIQTIPRVLQKKKKTTQRFSSVLFFFVSKWTFEALQREAVAKHKKCFLEGNHLIHTLFSNKLCNMFYVYQCSLTCSIEKARLITWF